MSLKPIDQVPFRAVAGHAAQRIAALQSGLVDALLLDIPNVPVAEKFGAHVLIDMLKLEKPLPYPFATTITTKSYIRSNPKEVRAAVRALIEGVYHYKTKREDTIRILGKYLRTSDKALLADTYTFSSNLIQRTPYVISEAVGSVLNQISMSNPELTAKIRQSDPQSFIDMRFIKEAEEDGFIASLYKGR
jgi:ABC-type nitrate/sulfonate/bicarbonate transport system substrate-binding protein